VMDREPGIGVGRARVVRPGVMIPVSSEDARAASTDETHGAGRTRGPNRSEIADTVPGGVIALPAAAAASWALDIAARVRHLERERVEIDGEAGIPSVHGDVDPTDMGEIDRAVIREEAH